MAKDAKKELLHFIDHKAFDVILRKNKKDLNEDEKKALEDMQDKTEKEKKKFHGYSSAKEIKENFLENTRSGAAKRLDKKLERLNLPTLPNLKKDFIALCDKLEV
jgi:hypothetical protein